MQAFLHAMSCLFHIMVFGTIWLNEAVLISGKPNLLLLSFLSNDCRPRNPQELFNLHHAQAQNIIE
jgi:hypothetical protein